MTHETAQQAFTALAGELTKLGLPASVEGAWKGYRGARLAVEGHPALRSPEVRLDVRGVYYVWDQKVYRRPATLARTIATFLKGTIFQK